MTAFKTSPRKAILTPDPNFEKRIRHSFDNQGALQELGGKMTAVGPGFVEIHLPVSRGALQQHGLFHGGIVTTVADSASGYATYSVLTPDEECLSVEFKINFLYPARGDMLIARGNVIKAGRTLVIAEATVSVVNHGEERECALMLHTLAKAKHVTQV